LRNNRSSTFTPAFFPTGISPDKLPFISQKEFDGFVERCATLDTIVGQDKVFYGNPASTMFRTGMPNLKTLRVMQDPRDRLLRPPSKPDLSPNSLPFPLFQGQTPRLRELCLQFFHARWEDPIYRNLTNLRLGNPQQKASVSQILKILRACPRLTDLDLMRCLIEQPSRLSKPNNNLSETTIAELDSHIIVALPHLKYFRFEGFDQSPTDSFLSSLSTKQLEYLHLQPVNPNRIHPPNRDAPKTYFTDSIGRPLALFAETIREPTYLCVSMQPSRLYLSALYAVNEISSNRPLKRFSPNFMIPSEFHSSISIEAQLEAEEQRRTKAKGNKNEAGLWIFVISMDTGGSTSLTDADLEDWKAVGLSSGLPITEFPTLFTSSPPSVTTKTPTFASSIPVPNPSPFSQVMPNNYTVIPSKGLSGASEHLSDRLLELFDDAAMGGVQFHRIEKLQLQTGFNFPDRLYRDLFVRCSSVRKLKASFDRGVGILVAVIRDDMMPLLEEVHLECTVTYGSTFGERLLGFLASWLEARQRRAAQELTGDLIRRLKKIVIISKGAGMLLLKDDTRKRVEDALGDDGQFVWRSKTNQWHELQIRWKKVLETNDGNPFDVNRSEIASANTDAEYDTDNGNDGMTPRMGFYDPLDDEWSLGSHDEVRGWSAGPW
jgi:hypothetical protein